MSVFYAWDTVRLSFHQKCCETPFRCWRFCSSFADCFCFHASKMRSLCCNFVSKSVNRNLFKTYPRYLFAMVTDGLDENEDNTRSFYCETNVTYLKTVIWCYSTHIWRYTNRPICIGLWLGGQVIGQNDQWLVPQVIGHSVIYCRETLLLHTWLMLPYW